MCHLPLLTNLYLCWPLLLLTAGSLITLLTWQPLQKHCFPEKVLLTCRLCWFTHHLILNTLESVQSLQFYPMHSFLLFCKFWLKRNIGLFSFQFGKIIIISFPWILTLSQNCCQGLAIMNNGVSIFANITLL
jgi:hypothetical protein